MRSDEQAIREVHAVWIGAVNAGDLDCLLDLMAEEAVFLQPGQPPFGREGFAAAFSGAHHRMQVRCESALEEVVVAGEVAYTRSRDTLAVTGLADGATARWAGHRITVYRKQADGRWLLARDAHTLSPVEAAEP